MIRGEPDSARRGHIHRTSLLGATGILTRALNRGPPAYEKRTDSPTGRKEFRIKRAMIRTRHRPKEIATCSRLPKRIADGAMLAL